MDDDYVFIKLHTLAILLVVVEENFLCLASEMVFAAMQGVMKSLGYFKEIVAAGNYVPMGDDAQFDDQRNEAIEHFSDAAAHGRRVHHFDAFTLQRVC